MKKLTLQWRITLLTALVLAAATVSLTVLSIRNAEDAFIVILEEAALVQDAIPFHGVEGPITMDVIELPAMPSTPAQLAKWQFDLRSVLFCVIFTALGAVAAYFAAGRALKPLRELSAAVSAVDENNLDHPLPPAQTGDEVGVLTDRFNQMLSRLDDAFLRQKRFTASAAHELKTPLAVMKTGAQVLSADPNATLADYRDHARDTLAGVERLSGIVDDLLLLSSVEAGGAVEREEVMLEPLFEAILGELSPLLEARGMVCQVACGELTAQGDASLLYRAFANLVENACKYGRAGGHIWVEASRQGEKVAVRVRDDGPGIAGEHLPYLFDAFYRVDKSRSWEMGGAGLGLSLVKTMVEAQGGAITVQSDGESGACFTVTLRG